MADWLTRGGWVLPVILLVSYLIGSIPVGLLVARVFKVEDVTELGSGSSGTTNVARVAGFWPAGFVTFVLDTTKGVVPVLLLAIPTLQETWRESAKAYGIAIEFSPTLAWAAGLAMVLGHCYSPFLNFRGGKGVAPTFGILLVLSPASALIGVIGFGATFFNTRIASLSSLVALVTATVAYLIAHPVIEAHLWVGAAIAAVILFRHESNIDALLDNREAGF